MYMYSEYMYISGVCSLSMMSLLQVLRPVAHMQKMQLWHAMFTSPILTPSSTLTHTHNALERSSSSSRVNVVTVWPSQLQLVSLVSSCISFSFSYQSASILSTSQFASFTKKLVCLQEGKKKFKKATVTESSGGGESEGQGSEVAFRKNGLASEHPLSDSSFASVSSSPSPHTPRKNKEGGEFQTPGADGERQQDGEGEDDGEREGEEQREAEDGEKSPAGLGGEAVAEEDASSAPPETQTSPASTTSSSTTIATGSAPLQPNNNNNNITVATGSAHHDIPTTSLPESPNRRQLNTMDTDLLHDAMHDHSPQQRRLKRASVNGVAHRGRKSTDSVRERDEMIDRVDSRGGLGSVGLDEDGLSSRSSEADRRLTYILRSYAARIADLRRELFEAKAAAVAARGREGREGTREKEEGERVMVEEEATTVGISLGENQVCIHVHAVTTKQVP